MWRARAQDTEEAAWMQPLREIAEELGFHDLRQALEVAHPANWYRECGNNVNKFDNLMTQWVEELIVPMFAAERNRAVRKDIGRSFARVGASSHQLANNVGKQNTLTAGAVRSSGAKDSTSSLSEENEGSIMRKARRSITGKLTSTMKRLSQSSSYSSKGKKDIEQGNSRRRSMNKGIV
eukprot:gnl/MRDRNA2_/MRDRNA2_73026_c0_seq1.p1 gnl/MRDRNA2_/MRDRNA2_73026_c0~~gnl/MRDRNA2_/MRDRNA2_73026_c0_seq1.p1  ORF type:complete len:179 (-),score=24.82 gnl/MRDRNA2_/MRDRNA2_73026_c0_seq1:143-679(-)